MSAPGTQMFGERQWPRPSLRATARPGVPPPPAGPQQGFDVMQDPPLHVRLVDSAPNHLRRTRTYQPYVGPTLHYAGHDMGTQTEPVGFYPRPFMQRPLIFDHRARHVVFPGDRGPEYEPAQFGLSETISMTERNLRRPLSEEEIVELIVNICKTYIDNGLGTVEISTDRGVLDVAFFIAVLERRSEQIGLMGEVICDWFRERMRRRLNEDGLLPERWGHLGTDGFYDP